MFQLVVSKITMSSGEIRTPHRGFYLEFENGVYVSVQWGPGHRCEAHDKHGYEIKSRTAEVLALRGPCSLERSYITADELVKLLAKLAALSPTEYFDGTL